jgi:hypothetical protein
MENKAVREELVWSYGEKPQRSQRRPVYVQEQPIVPTHSTTNRCLLGNEDMLSLKNVENEWRRTSKREESYNKIAEREMIGQRGFNPFNPVNSYYDNLVEHERYVNN